MKNYKMISALAALLVCLTLAVSVAAEAPAPEVPLSYTLETSAATVKPGDVVTVTLGIAENTGFYHTVVGLSYNPNLFIIEGEDPATLSGIAIEMNTGEYGDNIAVDNTAPGLITVTIGGDPFTVYGNVNATKYINNGVLITATFRVKEALEADAGPLFSLVADPGKLLVDNMKVGVGSGEEGFAKKVSETIVQNTNIIAPNHDCMNYETGIREAVEPDCLNTGLTEGSYCSFCGLTLTEQQEIPELGHIGGEATCDTPAICDRCHEPYGEVRPHTWLWVTDREPTYTVPGLKHEMCINVGCDATRNEGTTIELKICEHTLEKTEAVQTSCANDGMREYWRCTTCMRLFADEAGNLETTLEELKIPALPHKEEILASKEADCLNTGLTEGRRCTICQQITVEQEVIPALNHNLKKIPGVPATCTTPGLSDGMQCQRCGVITVQQEQTPTSAHTEELLEGKTATCTTPGLSEGKKCTVCGAVLLEQKEIPSIAHKFSAWQTVKEATTKEAGQQKRNCITCGEEETREVPMLKAETISVPVIIALSIAGASLIGLVVVFVIYTKRK